MIKKVFLAALLVVLVSVSLLAAYIFSLKAETPGRDINPTAVLHDERYQNQAAAAEQWLQSLYQHQLLPSIAAAIGIDGELVWEGAIGFSDIDNSLLANPHTQYRIGSISKAMTAVAAMRMQEKNLLDINAPFNTYVKDYAASHANITLKQLLSHQAGIRHYVNQFSENFSNTQYTSTREAAAIVEHDTLLFAPGESFHYSTYGYTLAALAMESAYAVPFEKIMYNEVFTPAAMTATAFAKSDHPAQPSQAVPYLHISDSLFQSPSVNFSNKYAGGGYLSTPSDVVRFANKLCLQKLPQKHYGRLLH